MLANRKTVQRMERQFYEWKDSFTNGKTVLRMEGQFYERKDRFTNGKTVLRMERQFYKWKDSFSNGKTVFRMERQFYERNESFTNGKTVLPTERQFYERKNNLTEEIKLLNFVPGKLIKAIKNNIFLDMLNYSWRVRSKYYKKSGLFEMRINQGCIFFFKISLPTL